MRLDILTLLAASVTLALGTVACGSDDEITVPTPFAIELSVTAPSGGTVTQIDWTNPAGAVTTVMNPTLPWSVQEAYLSGQTAAIVVTGSTAGGETITATIQDDPLLTPVPSTYATQTCPENTNPCNINISHAF